MQVKLSILFGLTILGSLSAVANASQQPIDLGSAADFAVLTKSGISTTGTTSIVGDIGVSPIDSTGITGFSLALDATESFATSPVVNGVAYASDYAPPTPAYMTTVIGDMEIAYADAAGRSGDAVTELGAGNISGMTLAPGLYKWGTGLLITTDVTLAGSPCDVWIFQISQDLTIGDGVRILLGGGALSANIFWQVGGEATFGTTSHVEGTILSSTAIHLRTGASINGALLAQTAVTLDASSVVLPSRSADLGMSWFGEFHVVTLDPETGDGWLSHAEHGWLYKMATSDGIWFWDQIQNDWFWTNACTYPLLYRAGTGKWVYYQQEGRPAERWFYTYNNDSQNSGHWDKVTQ